MAKYIVTGLVAGALWVHDIYNIDKHRCKLSLVDGLAATDSVRNDPNNGLTRVERPAVVSSVKTLYIGRKPPTIR